MTLSGPDLTVTTTETEHGVDRPEREMVMLRLPGTGGIVLSVYLSVRSNWGSREGCNASLDS